MNKTSGVYMIVNKINGKFYIGSSHNIELRWSHHKSLLSNGRHNNRKLQRSYDKHGKDAFEFKVLEKVDRASLVQREQHYLDALQAVKHGFNITRCDGATKVSNFRLTDADLETLDMIRGLLSMGSKTEVIRHCLEAVRKQLVD